METKIKDLDVLAKYLDEQELKEIAASAAYDLFKSSLGTLNEYGKKNLDYYMKYGAYEAVRQHAQENEVDIARLSKNLNTRVAELISELKSYQIPYEHLLDAALVANKETIERKVNSVIDRLVTDDEKYDSVYRACTERVGEVIAEVVTAALKNFYSKEQ